MTHGYVRNSALPGAFMRLIKVVDQRLSNEPERYPIQQPYDYYHILEEPTVSMIQVLYPVSGWVPAAPSWIPYHPCGHRQNVLAGMPLYAVALNAQTKNWWVMEGTKVTSAVANPVIMGSEYRWPAPSPFRYCDGPRMMWTEPGVLWLVLCTSSPAWRSGRFPKP